MLIDSNGKIISKGKSHISHWTPTDAEAIHAERHALEHAHTDLSGATMVTWAVDLRTEKISWSSAPCGSCAKILLKNKVSRVVYPKYDINAGKWTIVETTPQELLDSVESFDGKYAKDMRTMVL